MNRLAGVRSDDSGAYSILYGVIMVVVLALAAILVDISSVRADRRTAKAAADSGAVAGAGSLGITEPNPRQACRDAVRFAAASLGIATGYATTACDPLPDTAGCTSTTGMNTIPVTLPKNWTVTVYWPVRDESGLMQNPSVENSLETPVQTPGVADGGICSRVGVDVNRNAPLALGAVLGHKLAGGGRSQRSVALAEIRPGGGKVVAPLIVLDRHACNVLNVTGNGGVDVLDNGDTPGVIAVDSDATHSQCNTTNKTAMTVTNNSHIRAWDSATGAKGVILSYAIPARESYAYQAPQTRDGCQSPPRVFDPAYPLCPRPVQSGARFGRGAFDIRYNCTTCTATNVDYINQLKRYVGMPTAPTEVYNTDRPAMPVAATSTCNLPASPIVGDIHISCTTGSQTVTTSGTTIFRGGKVRIDAKKLIVTGRLVFENTAQVNLNVEEVVVQSGDCLVFNPPDRFVGAPETLNQTCSAATALETPTGYLVSGDMPPVWIRGQLNISGSFIARQTFIMQPPNGPAPWSGRLNVATVGDRIYWSAPFGDDTFKLVGGVWVATPTPCVPKVASDPMSYPSSGCFEDLSAWNEWNGDPLNNGNKLNGQSQVFVDGTWFVPDTSFTFGGGSDQSQTRAQFVALQLNLNGSGMLKMSPDAERATSSPFVIGALIR